MAREQIAVTVERRQRQTVSVALPKHLSKETAKAYAEECAMGRLTQGGWNTVHGPVVVEK